MTGSISVIGIGPGSPDWLAPAAEETLRQADVILGYQTYLRQIEHISPDTPRRSSGMRHELERAWLAVELARQGKKVALVSGGDAGIYGMAGLVLELLEEHPGENIEVEVLPGITALSAAAALLGAPLMTDFAVISLSDYLIPLETILNRVKAAIQGDFVICLYNPRGRQRTEPFRRAHDLMLARLGEDRPAGVVRAAYREGQQVTVANLGRLAEIEIDMQCLVVVGNSTTRILAGRLVTPRGYPIRQKIEAEK